MHSINQNTIRGSVGNALFKLFLSPFLNWIWFHRRKFCLSCFSLLITWSVTMWLCRVTLYRQKDPSRPQDQYKSKDIKKQTRMDKGTADNLWNPIKIVHVANRGLQPHSTVLQLSTFITISCSQKQKSRIGVDPPAGVMLHRELIRKDGKGGWRVLGYECVFC